jgi:hypothetical protein
LIGCLWDDEITPRAIIHRITLRLHRRQLVRDGPDHAQREGGIRHMSVLVLETPIIGRNLVVAELRPHGVINQLGQVVRDFDIGAETEEYIAGLACLVLLTPNTLSQKLAMAPMQPSSGMRFLR